MTVQRESSTLLSCIFAFSTPVLLAVYWPLNGMGLSWAPMAVRAGVLLCTTLLALLWWQAPTTESEVKWTVLFGGYLASLLIPSLLATDIARALANWSRIAILLVVCLAIARAFRHPSTRAAFGVGSLLGSLLLTAYIVFLYVRYSGFGMPTYESTRVLKATVLHAAGVGFNPMAFSSTFLCILALCLLRQSMWLYSVLAFVIGVGTGLTGSRTPFALMVASLVIVVAVRFVKQRQKFFTFVVALAALASVAVIAYLVGHFDMHRWSVITEGRIDIWTVAWAKFLEKPFTGFGAESWRDDLVSRMPGYYEYAGSLVKMHTGGYHNAYLTLLAEEGAPVFCIAAFLLAFAYRRCLLGLTSASQIKNQWVILFGLVFLTLRGMIEVPGLFGYGQDPAEFTAYAFMGIIISSFVIKSPQPKSQPTDRLQTQAQTSFAFAH